MSESVLIFTDPSPNTDETVPVNNHAASDTNIIWYFPPEIKQAILRGDVAGYQQAKFIHAEDLEPNFNAIEKRGCEAFVTVTNRSNGQKYYLSASGSGWIWVYTTNVEHIRLGVNASNLNKSRATVSIGCFSKNARFMGISILILRDLPFLVTALEVSSIALRDVLTVSGKLPGGGSLSRLFGMPDFRRDFDSPGDIISDGMNLLIRACSGFCSDRSSPIAVDDMLFLFDAMREPFGIEVNIYNWDPEEQWDVVDWYPENAVVLGNSKDSENEKNMLDSEKAGLRPISSEYIHYGIGCVSYHFIIDQSRTPIPRPDGFPVSCESVVSCATYVFKKCKFTADADHYLPTLTSGYFSHQVRK